MIEIYSRTGEKRMKQVVERIPAFENGFSRGKRKQRTKKNKVEKNTLTENGTGKKKSREQQE